jgi:hypothetical protein
LREDVYHLDILFSQPVKVPVNSCLDHHGGLLLENYHFLLVLDFIEHL